MKHNPDSLSGRNIRQSLYYFRKKGKLTYKQAVNKTLIGARSRAKQRGIEFDISLEDVIINTICPVLGIKLGHEGSRDNTLSLDRVDPSLGYVKGNVRIISHLANRWKNNMTLEDAKLLVSNWNKFSA